MLKGKISPFRPKGESILYFIGATPIVRMRGLPSKEEATVWAKLELFNPGGSVKDRICP